MITEMYTSNDYKYKKQTKIYMSSVMRIKVNVKNSCDTILQPRNMSTCTCASRIYQTSLKVI